VQCLVNTDCPAIRPSCDTTTHSCRCRVPGAGNLLKNPNFDGFSGLTIPSWNNLTGSPGPDADGCPESTSVLIANMENDPNQCIPLGPGTYTMGGRFKGGQLGNFVRIHFFTLDNVCTPGGPIPDPTTADLQLPAVQTDWTPVTVQFTAPPGTLSVQIGVYGLNQSVDQLFINSSSCNSFASCF
jgi:hypothetical protein